MFIQKKFPIKDTLKTCFFFGNVKLGRNERNFQKQPQEVFSCEFCAISKNNFFTEHFWATASELFIKMFSYDRFAICFL